MSALDDLRVLDALCPQVPTAPVQDVADIVEDDHLEEREMFTSVRQPGADEEVTVAGTPLGFSETPPGGRGLHCSTNTATNHSAMSRTVTSAGPARKRRSHHRPEGWIERNCPVSAQGAVSSPNPVMAAASRRGIW